MKRLVAVKFKSERKGEVSRRRSAQRGKGELLLDQNGVQGKDNISMTQKRRICLSYFTLDFVLFRLTHTKK